MRHIGPSCSTFSALPPDIKSLTSDKCRNTSSYHARGTSTISVQEYFATHLLQHIKRKLIWQNLALSGTAACVIGHPPKICLHTQDYGDCRRDGILSGRGQDRIYVYLCQQPLVFHLLYRKFKPAWRVSRKTEKIFESLSFGITKISQLCLGSGVSWPQSHEFQLQ
jgi:hypothetical protein